MGIIKISLRTNRTALENSDFVRNDACSVFIIKKTSMEVITSSFCVTILIQNRTEHIFY